MITIYKTRRNKVLARGNEIIARGNELITELRGLSTDTKPVSMVDELGNTLEVDNGAVFIEINTQKVFFFDGYSNTWKGV